MFIYRRAGLMAGLTFKVGTVTVTNAGSNEYTGTPTVVFTGGGGTGASATANMTSFGSAGPVTSVGGTMSGYYTTVSAFPTINFTGGGGSGAVAAFTAWGPNVVAAATGAVEVSVSSNVSFTISGGGGSGATVANQAGPFVPRRGRVASVPIGNPGTGYATAPTVSFTPRAGVTTVTLPTATATTNGSQLTGITITNAGTNEFIRDSNSAVFPYDVSFSGGGGSGATATGGNGNLTGITWWAGPSALDGSGSNLGITFTNRGTGYTSNPTLAASNTVGNDTLATQIGRQMDVDTISVSSGGSYTSTPSVSVSGGTPIGTPTVSLVASGTWGTRYRVNTITVNTQGSGYRSAPTISFSGGGEVVPATAVANMIPV